MIADRSQPDRPSRAAFANEAACLGSRCNGGSVTMYASFMAGLVGIPCDPLQCIQLAGRYGFEGVDLSLSRYGDMIETLGVDRLKQAMDQAQVRPGYCVLLPHNLSVDDDAWRDALERLPRLAGLAQRLGYTRTAVVILPFHETWAFDRVFAQHLGRIDQVMRVLRDHGLRLGLEYVSPLTRRAGKPHPFIHDLRGTLELIRACSDPHVGLMLDSFHWHCAGETAEDLLRLNGQQIVVVHINDAVIGRPKDQQDVAERELPGETGMIDLASFMGSLRQIGYDGPVTAEPTNPRWRTMEPETVCARTAAAVLRWVRS